MLLQHRLLTADQPDTDPHLPDSELHREAAAELLDLEVRNRLASVHREITFRPIRHSRLSRELSNLVRVSAAPALARAAADNASVSVAEGYPLSPC